MKRIGLTLMEEEFCQLVALGKMATEAYIDAFGKVPIDERERKRITVRASKLANRADIASRIVEAKGEQARRNKEKWQQRGDEIAEEIFSAISRQKGRSDENGRPLILNKDTLKGVEVLAKLKGLNAPDVNVLKNGGNAEDDTPRGLEAVSEQDLDRIISSSETIDVTPEDVG